MNKTLLLASTLALVASGALAKDGMDMSDAALSVDTDIAAAQERGQELYEYVVICGACHGMDGAGDIAPALNVDGAMPTDIIFQLETNPQMAPVATSLQPYKAQDLFDIAVHISHLAGHEFTVGKVEELTTSAKAAVRSTEDKVVYPVSAYDEKIMEIQAFSQVKETWERRSKEGNIKSEFEAKLLASFDPGEQIFFPEPGKTYYIENAGISTSKYAQMGATVGADSTQVVIGDVETKEIIVSNKMPRELRGDIHTTFATPDGRYSYIIGARPDGGQENSVAASQLNNPATMMKVDTLTLNPVEVYDIGGRIHHGQIFQEDLLLIDTFGRDPDGLDVFLFDPEKGEIIGGVRDEDLGGSTYTAFTDHEYIYMLMEPVGYGPQAGTGFVGGQKLNKGELITMRPFWVAKLDPKTWEVVAEFPYPGYRGDWIEIDAAGEFLYIPNGSSNNVVKMNAETGEIVWVGITGMGPYGAALTADESELWVADKGETLGMYGRTVTVLDAETGKNKETLFSGYQVDHILLSPDGKEMWASSNGEGRIYVWDIETKEQTHVIDMPDNGDAHGIVFVHYDEDGNSAVVRDQGSFHNGVNPQLGKPLN